jgi:hypothetical protein
VFGWLFRRPLNREQAIAVATDFLAANGCCVVPTKADADLAGNAIPYVFKSATIPGRRWYVEFVRVRPPGVVGSHDVLVVYVWADTGLVTFDAYEGVHDPHP